MKALVYQGPGILNIEERPVPRPGKGEVQIRIKFVSICGSDLGAYRFASDRFAPPLVLGHEFSGVVSEVGEGVAKLRVGQKVTVNPMVICNDCFYCKRGEGNLCGNRRSLGTAIGGTQTDGAMREYITVPEWMVVPLRDSVSFRSGAMLEPCGVTLSCAKCGHTQDEQNVLVMGAGPIGLLIVKFLKALGVPNVIASDVIETRLQKAKECGADHVVNAAKENTETAVKSWTDGYGADRVIIAAGVPTAIPESFRLVRNGGTIVLVTLMHQNVEIDPMEIVGRGIKFLGSYMFTTEMAEAAEMIADGKLEIEDLITSTFPLEEGKKAFDILNTPNNTEIKIQLFVSD